MKKALVVVLLVVLLLSFSLIGQAQTTTLRFAWWGSQTRHDKTLEVIRLFQQKYPDIKIQPEFTGWDGYFDKMAAQSAGGNLPDIMQQDIKFILQYAQNGLLVDLQPFVGKIIDFTYTDEAVMSAGRVHNGLYGVTLGSNTYVMMYDPQILAKAGVAEPTPDWTWEDFMDTARKIKKNAKVFAADALPMSFRNISGLEHYIRQHGQSFFSADGKRLNFEDRLFIEFYEMDLQLTREGVFTSPEVRMERHTVENDLMVTGQAAMAGYWTNQIVAITKAAGRPIKMALFPKAKNQVKNGTYLKPSMFLSITKNCKNQEAAAKFIDFFINDIQAGKVLQADRGVPVSSKVRNAMAPELDPASKAMFDMVALAGKHATPIDPPPPPQFSQILDILEDVHVKMLYGQITAKQGAAEFKERANKVLAGN